MQVHCTQTDWLANRLRPDPATPLAKVKDGHFCRKAIKIHGVRSAIDEQKQQRSTQSGTYCCLYSPITLRVFLCTSSVMSPGCLPAAKLHTVVFVLKWSLNGRTNNTVQARSTITGLDERQQEKAEHCLLWAWGRGEKIDCQLKTWETGKRWGRTAAYSISFLTPLMHFASPLARSGGRLCRHILSPIH